MTESGPLYQYPMNRTGVIYMLRNELTGLCYIGQTVQERRLTRINIHFNAAYNKNERDYNTKLGRAIRKYGKEAFTKHQLIECLEEYLDMYEIAMIRKYNSFDNGYNLTSGGQFNGTKRASGKDHCQYGKTGEKCKIFGRVMESTKQKYDIINQARILKSEGMKVTEIAEKFGVHRETIRNWSGPDYEFLGSPTTSVCSIRKYSANRTKRTEDARKEVSTE